MQKALELEANATGMSTAKNQQNFFKNSEKQRGAQNTIKKFIIDDTEVTDQTCILNHIKDFYEALFKKREQKTTAEIKNFLNAIDVPKLSENQVKLCEKDLTEKRFIQVFKKHAK